MKINEIEIGDLIFEREKKLIGVLVDKKKSNNINGMVLIYWNNQIFDGTNQTWEFSSEISKVGDLLEITVLPF